MQERSVPVPASIQEAHVKRYAAMAEQQMIISLFCMLIGLCTGGGLALAGMPAWGTAVAIVGIAGMAVFGARATAFTKRRDGMVYIPGSTPVDEAVHSVTELLKLYKTPGRTTEDLEAAGRVMAKRLHAISYEPLKSIRRSGYHPMGDSYETEGLDFQWSMVETSIRRLLELFQGSKEGITDDVQGALRLMVPPLRNILRRAGVVVAELEYGGYDPRTLAPPTSKELKAVRGPKTPKALALPETLSEDTAVASAEPVRLMHEDLFTPVERDMNAAAALTVATLRAQIVAFRAADSALFPGTDRQSGEALIEMHLPSLLRAFRTAHDASQGEERDEARMQFSRALGTVRDSLGQIMDRHAAEARALLATEARFLESRNGEGAFRL